MISEKSFLSGYLHRDRKLHSKFHISSSSSLGCALICQSVSQFLLLYIYRWYWINLNLNISFFNMRNDIPHLVMLAILRFFNIAIWRIYLKNSERIDPKICKWMEWKWWKMRHGMIKIDGGFCPKLELWTKWYMTLDEEEACYHGAICILQESLPTDTKVSILFDIA